MKSATAQRIDDTIIEDTSYGGAFTLRNDILVEMKDGRCFVLDTKYKQLDRIENSRESAAAIQQQIMIDDLRQVREYAYKRNLREGYLLYPIYRFEELDSPQKATLKGSIEVGGSKYPIDVHAIRIPFIFEDDIEDTKRKLASVIHSIFL